MRTYTNLSPSERDKAQDIALNSLLEAIVEGAVRFCDALNGDDLQERIDNAFAEAEAKRTPWFVSEYIMDTAREDLRNIATCDAQNALYPEPGQYIIRL